MINRWRTACVKNGRVSGGKHTLVNLDRIKSSWVYSLMDKGTTECARQISGIGLDFKRRRPPRQG